MKFNYENIKDKAKSMAKTARDFSLAVLLTGIPSWGALQLDDAFRGETNPVSRDYAEIDRKGLETDVTRSYYGIKLILKDKDGDQKVDEKYLSAFGLTSKNLGIDIPFDQKMYDTAFADYGRGK